MTIDEIEKFRKQCNDFLDKLIKEQTENQHIQEGDIVTLKESFEVGIVVKIYEDFCLLWLDENLPVLALKDSIINTGRHCLSWKKYRKKAEEYYEA